MNQQVFKYLSHYSTRPQDIDRLFVSAFLKVNNIKVKKNKYLKSFIIQEKDCREYEELIKFIAIIQKEVEEFSTERLIELFEFVISPSDRVINGAIYTPTNIRKFIINETFNYKGTGLITAKISDISCGCGGFLFSAATLLKQKTNKSYREIFETQIFGLDIQDYSVTRTKLLLSILAIIEGEDEKEFTFNIFVGDSLTFHWDEHLINFSGFDIIVGNPPYVCSRHISIETKLNLEKWDVCKSGHPDLYIPFFQIGIENLAENGILGFITMNTFFKSMNGRALREYFQKHSLGFNIIDFGTEQIFKSRNTYTCICLIEKTHSHFIKYTKSDSKSLMQKTFLFKEVHYSKLDSKKGWNLNENEVIAKIESTGVPFGSIYKTRNGIATLRNDIYIFTPVSEDKDYYYLQNGSLYEIEKGICRDIVNSNRLSKVNSLITSTEKVIFPYDNDGKPKLLDENYIKDTYPKAYLYLQHKKAILAQRDKGKQLYEKWFAFGRNQSLEKMKFKLFYPQITNKIPTCIINTDDNLLFYNGLAVVGQSIKELTVIKKIMETRLFWYYIENTSKPYISGYYALSYNYIKNFGICNLDSDEIEFVLKEKNRDKLNTFFEEKYNVNL